MIKTVKGLKIDDLFEHEGNVFKVTYFPTRNMVCACAASRMESQKYNIYWMVCRPSGRNVISGSRLSEIKSS